jgi:hypothetical protein
MVILNLISPLIILCVVLILSLKNARFLQSKKAFRFLGFVFCSITLPLILTDYHYYNWVLEYFKVPVMLISCALIVATLISNKYFKSSIISLLSVAFIFNFTYQFILQMAQMGGGWKPNNCPDFDPPLSTYESYSLVKGSGYFIHKTKLNGALYSEVSHKWKLNSGCETIFEANDLDESIIYDSCRNELRMKK